MQIPLRILSHNELRENFDNLQMILKLRKQILTCPRRSSAKTQPADQTSIAVVYSVAPNISSGAL
jgi:hypothetical protein